MHDDSPMLRARRASDLVRYHHHTKEGKTMSMMCSMQGCTQKHGMCGHEKMMIVMMVMAMVGGAAYWILG